MENSLNIDDLKAGNHKAYERLFSEWYSPLCNYAFSIVRDAEDSKDIVQKMFYTLWDQRERIEIHTSIKSYLYRMVHNECLNKIKQSKIRSEHHRFIGAEREDTNNTEELVLGNELQKELNEAVNELPPRCREVFMLSRYKQLSYAEIAEKLDISKNTVETQMVKALKSLRIKLSPYLFLLILIHLGIK